MEDKRVGKSNRSKAICITVIVLLCIGLTGLFLMEYRSGNTNRKQKGSKNHTAEQTEQPIDWDSLQKVKLNHHKYGLLHKVTSWLIIGTDVSGNQDGIGEDYQGAMADFMFEYESDGNVVAVKKGNEELLAAVNEVIDEVNENGLYEVWKADAMELANSLGIETH